MQSWESEEFNHDYLPLVRQCENLPNPPLLGYPEVWEGRRSKCKMMHRGGTVIEHSKRNNFLLYWEKDSFSRPVVLLMKYETLVKNFGSCVATTAPWNSGTAEYSYICHGVNKTHVHHSPSCYTYDRFYVSYKDLYLIFPVYYNKYISCQA